MAPRFLGDVFTNLLITVTKYVAGRVIRSSLGLFQDLLITFNMGYVASVNHSMFLGICRRQFKTFAKYFEGRQESLALFQSLAICSVTDKSTINTTIFVVMHQRG